MSSAQDAAIAFSLAGYAATSEPCKIVATVKVKVSKPTGEVKAPANNGPKAEVLNFPLPDKGTLDAKSFLIAMRRAKTRQESIQAIAGYIGYDPMVPFGTQDSQARMLAQRVLNPPIAATTEYRHSAAPTVAGFVAGMPDHTKRHFQNLLARERHAVESMIQHEKDSRDAKTDQERTLYAGLALVERERLVQIRKDLKA